MSSAASFDAKVARHGELSQDEVIVPDSQLSDTVAEDAYLMRDASDLKDDVAPPSIDSLSAAARKDVGLARNYLRLQPTGSATGEQLMALMDNDKKRVVSVVDFLCRCAEMEVDMNLRPVRYAIKPQVPARQPIYAAWFNVDTMQPIDHGYGVRLLGCTARQHAPDRSFQRGNYLHHVLLDWQTSQMTCFLKKDDVWPICVMFMELRSKE